MFDVEKFTFIWSGYWAAALPPTRLWRCSHSNDEGHFKNSISSKKNQSWSFLTTPLVNSCQSCHWRAYIFQLWVLLMSLVSYEFLGKTSIFRHQIIQNSTAQCASLHLLVLEWVQRMGWWRAKCTGQQQLWTSLSRCVWLRGCLSTLCGWAHRPASNCVQHTTVSSIVNQNMRHPYFCKTPLCNIIGCQH